MNKYLLFFLLISAICISCGKSDKKIKIDANQLIKENPRNDLDMIRTHTDSAQVLNLASTYIELLKRSDYDSALGMLVNYDVSGDSIYALTDTQKSEILQSYRMFPVCSYTIDEVRFFSEKDTEVLYTIEWYVKDKDDEQPNTLQCAIYPCRVQGKWVLTLKKMKVERPVINN